MNSKNIQDLTEQYIMHTYGRFPVTIDHGEGAMLYSPEGQAYVDFTSGIGVSCLGYGSDGWAEAIAQQAKKLGHASNLFYTEPAARLAQILCQRTGMSNVFFANGGGEANEGMIKLARKYSFDRYGQGRSTILTLHNSFHGRTITTLKATGQEVFHNYFFPFTEGFRYADANDCASLEAAAGDDVCAVMVELVQGEGGVLPLEQDYVAAVAKLCAERDWLLLVDEVQTGVGLHAHDRAILDLQGIVHVYGLCDMVAQTVSHVGNLKGLVGFGENGVDLLLHRFRLVDHGHHFPDQDVAFPVHQIVTGLRQFPGLLRRHQITFGRQHRCHEKSPLSGGGGGVLYSRASAPSKSFHAPST